MRIISGKLGGRRISPPHNMPYTRPTTDIAKEGLFNILQNNLQLEGIKTLDLFGGTGCISYELASRGASEQVIVEKDPSMFQFIKKTADTLGIHHLQCVKMDVFKFIDQCEEQFDLIFAGPPYALETIDLLPIRIVEKALLKPNGVFILEHTPRNAYQNFPLFSSERNYGTTVFSFFIHRTED